MFKIWRTALNTTKYLQNWFTKRCDVFCKRTQGFGFLSFLCKIWHVVVKKHFFNQSKEIIFKPQARGWFVAPTLVVFLSEVWRSQLCRNFGRRFSPDGVDNVQSAEPAVRRVQRSHPTPQLFTLVLLQSPLVCACTSAHPHMQTDRCAYTHNDVHKCIQHTCGTYTPAALHTHTHTYTGTKFKKTNLLCAKLCLIIDLHI